MEGNYHLNKFLNCLLVRFTKFLDGIISKVISSQFRTHNEKLRNLQLASYRKMKYLESNLVCANVASLLVDKQNDTGYEMYERT